MINGNRIAVVVPTYNAEKSLEKTVQELSDVKYGLGVLATTLGFVAHKLGIRRAPRKGVTGRKVTQQYYSQSEQGSLESR